MRHPPVGMKRILFFNYEFPPLGGGSGNANAHLFREFARRGDLAVDCVTSSPGEKREIVRLHENVLLYRLAVGKRDPHFWTQRELGSYLLRARKETKSLLSRHRYELCHAFGGFPAGLLAWKLRRRLPYVLSLRGSDVPGFNPRFRWQYIVLGPVFRRIWREARSVIANSEGLKALANAFDPGLEVGVIPNGVDVETFRPHPSTPPSPAHILSVSRLVQRKGLRHLLDAFPGVLGRVPAAHLTVVGTGPREMSLRKQAREAGCMGNVTFAGEVPHESLPDFYRRAAVFVQPSFSEGMSNAVLEAMACGLPIVAAAEGGRKELYGSNVMMVPFGDVQSLARALTDLLGQPERLAAMGAESRRIAERYSWRKAADRYLEIYDRISNRSVGDRKP